MTLNVDMRNILNTATDKKAQHSGVCALFFFVMGFFENYLPGLAWNCDPPDLCLLSS
jgi:hypothetical protein